MAKTAAQNFGSASHFGSCRSSYWLKAETLCAFVVALFADICYGTSYPQELIVMIVQIYSMTTIDDAVATAEIGANLIGVVAGEPGVLAEAVDNNTARAIL